MKAAANAAFVFLEQLIPTLKKIITGSCNVFLNPPSYL